MLTSDARHIGTAEADILEQAVVHFSQLLSLASQFAAALKYPDQINPICQGFLPERSAC